MGVGVLVLSLALTGCGGKKKNKKHKSRSGSSHSRTIGGTTGGSGAKGTGTGSLGGAQDAKAILPPADTMPAALRTVSTELHSRAKAPSVCKDPGGKCKNAVANGRVGYRSNDKAEGASYDLVVYRNDRAARRAFAAWDSYVRNNKHELKVVDGPERGADSVTFGFTGPARKNTREIVILQGKFVATLGLRDNAGSADATQDLGVLAEVYAQRLRQASQGETPTATAANATV
ncbi:hypothetical protein OG302_08275 [Streptomyces sp. NBC_01283]|uniref:hypothetical protein n=1 Tax=Streptomyces sp. NBC_01283 TaxID=2903812 RepID=UPI00352C697B|nr:hypothetical protein OG302_08275 [Streptomyces sp. NBC_01283]